jgi:hypothetical protein
MILFTLSMVNIHSDQSEQLERTFDPTTSDPKERILLAKSKWHLIINVGYRQLHLKLRSNPSQLQHLP